MQNRPNDEAPGAYRDDRDAAHAKAASLQQRCDALAAENGALRAEKDTLLREVDRLRALVPGERPRRSRAAVMVAAGAVFAVMLVAGFLLATARQPAPMVEGDDFFHRSTPPAPPTLQVPPSIPPSVPPVQPQPQVAP